CCVFVCGFLFFGVVSVFLCFGVVWIVLGVMGGLVGGGGGVLGRGFGVVGVGVGGCGVWVWWGLGCWLCCGGLWVVWGVGCVVWGGGVVSFVVSVLVGGLGFVSGQLFAPRRVSLLGPKLPNPLAPFPARVRRVPSSCHLGRNRRRLFDRG
ncbi:hypothetical protein, partial [Pseudomonas syringae group genomosp. 7]|uniref:hypothetical protein n=1 Tax=Pseudomonas syringae group genomosp. 7 TaxID=251699 RepID=UPI0037705979